MKKNDIVTGYDFKATTMFISASVALTANAVLTYIMGAASLPQVLNYIFQFFTFAFILFAYIISIKGFIVVDKACRISEQNENFYMGRKLKRLTIVSLILSVIAECGVLFCYVLLSKYRAADSLTTADREAARNLSVVTAVVLIVLNLVSISVPYIIYLWKIHKFTTKKDSINNFALLTMIIMIVQLAIAILNSVYAIKNSSSSFLSGFAGILLIIKYILLMMFFITRRRGLIPEPKQDSPESVEDSGK